MVQLGSLLEAVLEDFSNYDDEDILLEGILILVRMKKMKRLYEDHPLTRS